MGTCFYVIGCKKLDPLLNFVIQMPEALEDESEKIDYMIDLVSKIEKWVDQ